MFTPVFTFTRFISAQVLCLPSFVVDRNLLKPMRLQVRGTILAGELAAKYGVAINIGGGMHHACHNQGGGWCVYSDIFLSFRNAQRRFPHIRTGMIVDCDVHQGNGLERDKGSFHKDDMFVVDLFNRVRPSIGRPLRKHSTPHPAFFF